MVVAGLNPDGADVNESSPVLSESDGVDVARLFWCCNITACAGDVRLLRMLGRLGRGVMSSVTGRSADAAAAAAAAAEGGVRVGVWSVRREGGGGGSRGDGVCESVCKGLPRPSYSRWSLNFTVGLRSGVDV